MYQMLIAQGVSPYHIGMMVKEDMLNEKKNSEKENIVPARNNSHNNVHTNKKYVG